MKKQVNKEYLNFKKGKNFIGAFLLKKILPIVCSFVLIFVSILVFLNNYNPSFNEPLTEMTEQEKQAWQRNIRAVNVYYATAAEETNAESFDPTYKGGSICLTNGVDFTMTGGTISNHKTKFGGAVYIGNGSTFTMEGGTITLCEAEYGGAIYVASGGICNITGNSTITGNKANYAPAIYAESGATINIGEDAVIDSNSVVVESGLEISTGTLVVGNPSAGLEMHYAEFGTYPQTFVGTTMNTKLETWYTQNSSNLAVLKTYTSGVPSDWGETQVTYQYRKWNAYKYTDGNIYARGISYPDKSDGSNYTYLDGSNMIVEEVAWFKVEPIQWLILNYDAYMAGEESEMELMSYLALNAEIPFYPNYEHDNCNLWYNSYLRGWLNDNFYSTAFSVANQEVISLSEVENNVTGDYANADSDGKGVATQDYIYCMSYYEMSTMFSSDEERVCSPTDFTLSNRVYINWDCPEDASITATRPDGGGACDYWLRSAGAWASDASGVDYLGSVDAYSDVSFYYYAVRPALRVSI